MKHSLLFITVPALVCMLSCHRGATNEASVAQEPQAGTDQSGEVVLTREQFDASGMKVGTPSKVMFSNEVVANGMIVSSLSGRARINTLIPGRVKQINQSVGDHVNRGEVLFLLESNEIIQLQQEYAEVVHQLVLLAADYERQKSLSDDKIVAQKDFLKTESEYRIMLSNAEALKARLRMINIDPAGVENGTILSVLQVPSPIGGVITRQELVLGQFIDPQVTVMEVVDTRKLQLILRVFEKDLAGMDMGQAVKFYTPDQKERIFEATVSHIGKSIDQETKTIQCIAKVQPADQGEFVNNLFVEARIVTCQRETLAIPEEAIVSDPDRDFVWVLTGEKDDQMTFRKIPVQTGPTRGGYTEVMDEDSTMILLEGAYNLWSEE